MCKYIHLQIPPNGFPFQVVTASNAANLWVRHCHCEAILHGYILLSISNSPASRATEGCAGSPGGLLSTPSHCTPCVCLLTINQVRVRLCVCVCVWDLERRHGTAPLGCRGSICKYLHNTAQPKHIHSPAKATIPLCSFSIMHLKLKLISPSLYDNTAI